MPMTWRLGVDLKVEINGSLARRGRSGSWRVVDLICTALRGHADVRVRVPSMPKSRALRIAKIFYSDMIGPLLRGRSADIYISPAGSGFGPSGKPHVLVMHDTMVLDRAGDFDPLFYAYARLTYGPSVQRADCILTGSHSAASAIRARWPNAPRVEVIRWPGMPDGLGTHRTFPSQRKRVLVLAATEPHKNHVGAIEAVRMVRLALNDDIALDLVGPLGRSESIIARTITLADPNSEWIVRHVDVSEDSLAQIWRRADVLLQPSFAEGYGLPVVEASGLGIPVIHGGIPSLVELHPKGNAGGTDPNSLAAGLARLFESEGTYAMASQDSLDAATHMTHDLFNKRLLSILRSLL